MQQSALHQFFIQSSQLFPDRPAVIEAGAFDITYQKLAELSDRVRDYLHYKGVKKGDRVGIYMRKSIDTVATLLGILKIGAAYVPVDPNAPVARNAFIMHDCKVALVVIDERFQQQLIHEIQNLGSSPNVLVISNPGGGIGIAAALESSDSTNRNHFETITPELRDLAYILYTSGSTGKPKGVMLSHENAINFINWCSEIFRPNEQDRFSSHAPFHFDLSILDIYLALKHGSALVLVPDDIGKDPNKLAPFIAEQKITCWYSAPSILSLLAQYGQLGSRDYSSLRLVLFAGEVFPIKHLRSLVNLLPNPRYFNLYGPTETNVCTSYEVKLPIPDERTIPFPIGEICAHLEGKVVDEYGNEVAKGNPGELCISGGNVMVGYWGQLEQSKKAFLEDDNTRWYRTGDIVVELDDGNYLYQGRRDRMVKRRGYRVELGEIEAALYRHSLIKEVAVVAVADEESGTRIKSFLSCKEKKHPSIIEMKRFCTENLPIYMTPDEFIWCEALPKTSTDKIDYQRLKEMN